MSTAEARARAVLAAIDGGVVAERPRYREATVLACVQCGHRFAIVNEEAAKRIEKYDSACKCGGRVKITGFYPRMEPRGRKDIRNG